MMRLPAFSVASVLALATVTAFVTAPSIGCSPAGSDDAESAEQASTASDLALAREAIAILGGESGKCNGCHAIDATRVRAWGTTMQSVEAACFADPAMSPADRVNCLRSTPSDPSSAFSARRLGLYAAGTTQDQFRQLFEAAGSTEYATFTQRATMPRGGANTLTSAEFEKVKGWVLRGMPQLDEAFRPDVDAGAPGPCTPSTTPELAAHLAAMKTSGWGARLADQATPMFGCGAATDPLECLTQLPDATLDFGAPGVDQKLRELHKQALTSRYWVRSSADGRYVGYGMYTSAKIVDLTKPTSAAPIKVRADYDPYFLPGNDGFAFAGAHSGGSIRVCRQSLLADVGGASNPSISLTEPKCASIGRNVYQSIGSALEGDRYFVTWGAHENDDGGHDITAPLPAAFDSRATTTFTPMVNNGQSYRAQTPVNVVLPKEGDMMLSPSSLLAATRFGTGQKQVGYRVRFVKATTSTSGSLRVDLPLAAEVCLPGAKAAFSFDERFVVTHQYVDHSEADQTGLPEGSSNIVLADLMTGKQVRITNAKAGEFALYPHFRADGWLYFIVRNMNTRQENVVASDIAVRLAAQ